MGRLPAASNRPTRSKSPLRIDDVGPKRAPHKRPGSHQATSPRTKHGLLVSAARLLNKNCPNVKAILNKTRRLSNAKCDPNRNKMPLIIGDQTVGAVLTRREQPPEAEQSQKEPLQRRPRSHQATHPRTRPLLLKASGRQKAEAESAKRKQLSYTPIGRLAGPAEMYTVWPRT